MTESETELYAVVTGTHGIGFESPDEIAAIFNTLQDANDYANCIENMDELIGIEIRHSGVGRHVYVVKCGHPYYVLYNKVWEKEDKYLAYIEETNALDKLGEMEDAKDYKIVKKDPIDPLEMGWIDIDRVMGIMDGCDSEEERMFDVCMKEEQEIISRAVFVTKEEYAKWK